MTITGDALQASVSGRRVRAWQPTKASLLQGTTDGPVGNGIYFQASGTVFHTITAFEVE